MNKTLILVLLCLLPNLAFSCMEKLYTVCYKDKKDSPIVCESIKLPKEEAIKRCGVLLKIKYFCEIK
jgi:hypothetical protein